MVEFMAISFSVVAMLPPKSTSMTRATPTPEVNAMILATGNTERRPGGERQIVRQRCNQMLGQRDIFGCGAEGAPIALAVIQPHTLTGVEPRHSLADLIDHTRAVAVGDHARKFHRAIAAGTAADIGGIDAGGVQAKPDFRGARLRRRHLTERQHIRRRARSLIPNRLHSVPGKAPPSSRMFCPVMKPALAPHRNA